ncbi:CoA-transferase subunit beta [Desulfosporosinus sp.]|uniref:CoA-transferase subunit beta n=1 Tax=Desulfosporosinus sp. TaxID=157907 RepID=UPI0025B8C5F4|nr:CoA-transferase [Desulfosporosinus sp.]MBC2722283.1 CoA-transferase subunit beta [Desulfosporosinus sp.]MBC2725993.1 CoA-transferase subunit beta [Desulfosporosinus sp.]
MAEYTSSQMMVVAMARQVIDGSTIIVGTGLPLVAASLAKNSTAPNVCLCFETGMIDGGPIEVPTSVSDMRISYTASALWSQVRYIGFQANAYKKNKINIGFLGGAQIDAFGNLNSTCIGDYWHPKTRFTGSGGANGIATNCNTIILMKHQKCRFCEKVDYLTSPGWIDGPDGRKKTGLPEVGPQAVVTELGIMRFDDKTKRMYLAEYFPGITPQKIQENTGFEMDISRAVEAEPPSQEILNILLNKVDPQRLMV